MNQLGDDPVFGASGFFLKQGFDVFGAGIGRWYYFCDCSGFDRCISVNFQDGFKDFEGFTH